MKLVTFLALSDDQPQAGWLDGGWVIGAAAAQAYCVARGRPVPSQSLTREMLSLIETPQSELDALTGALGDDRPDGVAWPLEEAKLMAPLPRPHTIRDFYAFEAHVKTARANRGLPMLDEWYRAPVFYFTNPNAVFGPGDAVPKPKATKWLDFELEVAIVVGKQGRDIRAEQAHEYIRGFMIMNDWSARDIQRQEMKVGLGPAKGKDFATSFGPWLVTPDELVDVQEGPHWRLAMSARVNGQEVSQGNLADLYFSFAQMIERASQDCTLYPGEVIGSGTVGTGCLLETSAAPWLEPGDVVELQVERLGTLTNQVR